MDREAKTPFKLPEGFILGTATAAAQIEGGEKNHDWYRWCELGRIKDKSSTLRANNHFELFRGDLKLMRDMKIKAYRFGVEWSRISPAAGELNQKAMARYVEEVELMLEYGIKPLCTLFHFAQPLWFADLGGFEKAENIKYFLDFTEYVVKAFGERVSEYITINEPNVFAYKGYAEGEWPPGKKSVGAAFKVMSNLAAAHIGAYKIIHKNCENAQVSFAHHQAVFEAKHTKNPFSRTVARIMENCFQTAVARACNTGVFKPPLKKPKKLDIAAGKYYDFNAINYYTRQTVSGFKARARQGAPVNDLGWELYPAGLAKVAEEYCAEYPAPLWITENGTCDGADSFRAEYIYNHLKALTGSSAPAERYYYWTFMDNFEWVEGESARFGLVECDFETQKRTVRKSGKFYTEIIENRGVTAEMLDKYFGG